MRFGFVPSPESAGQISAHTVRTGDLTLRKGRPIAAADAARLVAAGIRELVTVRLDPGDVGEDAAAERLALRFCGPGLRVEPASTGRCNLFADAAGLLLVEATVVDAVNAVDEAITAATLPAFRPVVPGEMVATVKIIPFAVAGTTLGRACIAAQVPLRLAPYNRGRVGVVSTLLPGLKATTIDKTLRSLANRLAPASAAMVFERRVPHTAASVAEGVVQAIEEGADIVVVFGASAISDRRDVIPAGLEAAGGRVEHFGMPVDPGNLLLLGTLGDVPVIGAPGCARSPKENGFDWILQRLLAGLDVRRADIVRLGVGGLLTEIVSRPQPRSGVQSVAEDE